MKVLMTLCFLKVQEDVFSLSEGSESFSSIPENWAAFVLLTLF